MAKSFVYLSIASLISIVAFPAHADTIPLPTGNYYAQGSMFSRSSRWIEEKGDRVCLSVVDGPARPYEGYLSITVSSLFMRGSRLHRDGDGMVLDVGSDGKSFHLNERAKWEHYIAQRGSSHLPTEMNLMSACLESSKPYSETTQGPFIKGMTFPKGRK